jgi:hypothetical protein
MKMAVLHRLSRNSIERDFTHYGWLFGCVPVYLSVTGYPSPRIAVRNGWPDWLLDVAEVAYLMVVDVRSRRDPSYQLHVPLTITGEIISDAKM